MYKSIFFVFIFIVIFIQCSNNKNDKIYLIINTIEKQHDEIFLKEFKQTSEKNILDLYFSYFLYEHNKLIKKNEDLNAFFQSLNLTKESSQAYLLLFLLHRKLNNKKLNLNGLLDIVNDNIIGIESCTSLKKINAVFNYKKLNIGDSVQLMFPVRIESNIKSTVFYLCPTLYWNFDNSKDLIINGELINKYYKIYPRGFYIQLKINSTNREDVLYFFKHIQRNDTIEVELDTYGIRID